MKTEDYAANFCLCDCQTALHS